MQNIELYELDRKDRRTERESRNEIRCAKGAQWVSGQRPAVLIQVLHAESEGSQRPEVT